MNKPRYPMSNVVPLTKPKPQEEIQWMTTKEAAEYLRTSTGVIRNLIFRGKIAAYHPFNGRKVLLKKSDLERAIGTPTKGGNYGNI